MKKLIKLLPVVLAMLMLFSFGAFAEETGETPDGEQDVTEVVLPKAPDRLSIDVDSMKSKGSVEVIWNEIPDVDGYNLYMKENGEWVLHRSIKSDLILLYELLFNSKYEIGVKSYITVDGIMYESEEMCTGTIVTPAFAPATDFLFGNNSVREGLKVCWSENYNVSGYRLYIRKDGKWVKIKDFYGVYNTEYIYKDVVDGEKYYFAIKSFVKGTEGLKFSSLSTAWYTFNDVRKVVVYGNNITSSSVKLNWQKVSGARGYRVYLYKDGKWKALKTTTSTSYIVTGLEASKKYIFRVRAYEKVNGETVWYPYSKNYSAITGSKTVDAYRIKNLQKSFSDGDWYVKLKNMSDGMGGKVTVTLAGKGENLFMRYDYGKGVVIEYFYQASKDRLYAISDGDREYAIVPKDEAEDFVDMMYAMAEILKVQNVGKVTAKTCVYNGYSAVKETYTDTRYGFKKTYYFVKDKVAGLTVDYQGVKDEFTSYSVTDTPSSSLFKVPSGYKKVSWN